MEMHYIVAIVAVLFVVGSALQYLDVWMHRQMAQFGPFAFLICLAIAGAVALGAFR